MTSTNRSKRPRHRKSRTKTRGPTRARAKAPPSSSGQSARPTPRLAHEPDLLALFEGDIAAIGLAGESRPAKLVYLSITSRLLKRPVSVVVEGNSSGGKSFVVRTVTQFFPVRAYYDLTAMSERALAYSNEPLEHRILIFYENAGIKGDVANYLVRSILSEGCVKYDTVESTPQGLRPRHIERKGPTGLIVTATGDLHPENATRLLAVTVDDSPAQTASIMLATKEDGDDGVGTARTVDLSAWCALQEWLQDCGVREVAIPYRATLAILVPPHHNAPTTRLPPGAFTDPDRGNASSGEPAT